MNIRICCLSKYYSGFAAGGFYTHGGGGTNYQCLPLNPQFDNVTHAGGSVSYIYGAEYQTHGYPSSIPAEAQDQNVPCARCDSGRSSVMMIPARHDCPLGWNREYHGKIAYETELSRVII